MLCLLETHLELSQTKLNLAFTFREAKIAANQKKKRADNEEAKKESNRSGVANNRVGNETKEGEPNDVA